MSTSQSSHLHVCPLEMLERLLRGGGVEKQTELVTVQCYWSGGDIESTCAARQTHWATASRHRDNSAHLMVLTGGSVKWPSGQVSRSLFPWRSWIKSKRAVFFRPAPARTGTKWKPKQNKTKNLQSLSFKEMEVFTYGNLLPRSVFRREVQFEQWECVWVILSFSMEAIWKDRKGAAGRENMYFLVWEQPMALFLALMNVLVAFRACIIC